LVLAVVAFEFAACNWITGSSFPHLAIHFPRVLLQKKTNFISALYRALFNLSSSRLPVFVLAFLSSPIRSAIETRRTATAS
jgi:hypothetical protein